MNRVKINPDLKKNLELLFPVGVCAVLLILFTLLLVPCVKADKSDKYSGFEKSESDLETLAILESIDKTLLLIEEQQGKSTEEIKAMVNQLLVLNHAFLTWAEGQGLIVREDG